MDIKIKDAWNLFNSLFKDGDSIHIVTDDDKDFQGKMLSTETGVYLSRITKKSKFFLWDDIRFISHDGFNIKKLFGADGSKSIEEEESKKTERRFRKATHFTAYSKRLTPSRYIFGDPFMVECDEVQRINTFYPGSKIFQPSWEELLLLKSKDGAVGMLYHFESIYFWE